MKALHKIIIFIFLFSVILIQGTRSENLSTFQYNNNIQKRSISSSKYTKHLKEFNIIVATLSNIDGVNRLKKQLDSDGQNNLIVRNKEGLYYIVLGSYDNEKDAVINAKAILDKYTRYYLKDELMRRYGIPFTDIWILEVIE